MHLLLLSGGGVDTWVTALTLLARGVDLSLIHYDYGQHAVYREWRSVRRLQEWRHPYEGKVHEAVPESLPCMHDSNITGGGDECYNPDIPRFVVNRNMILIAHAVRYAVLNGFAGVAGGWQESEVVDTTYAFLHHMSQAARLGSGDPHLVLQMPIVRLSKKEVVERGQELGVPWTETWSCFRAGPLHCGRCQACQRRIKAFADAGVDDLTCYV